MSSDLLAPRHQAKLHRSRSPARATSFHIPSSKSSAFSSPRAGRPTVSAVARSLAMASRVSTVHFEVDGQVGRPQPSVGQIHDVVEASGAAIRDLSDLTGGRRNRGARRRRRAVELRTARTDDFIVAHALFVGAYALMKITEVRARFYSVDYQEAEHRMEEVFSSGFITEPQPPSMASEST